MYLFVFLWVPLLQEHAVQPVLPFGYIFSSFMICMMLGSLFYTAIVSQCQQPSSSTKPSAAIDFSVTLHAKMSILVCAVSALALAGSVAWADERYRFWAFCLFEACVGLYYPVQGTLRGTLIPDEHRATVGFSPYLLSPIQMLTYCSYLPCSVSRLIFLSSFPSSQASQKRGLKSSWLAHSCCASRP
jgi:hypothetical protein